MKKPDGAEPADAWELSDLLRLLTGRLGRTLHKKSGANQLSLTSTAVLTRLEFNGSSTVTELANEEGMRPQSMSAIVAELETAGLVHGEPDPADGRRTLLSLTEAGWTAVRASRMERQGWLAHLICVKYSPAERRQLITAMKLLKRLI